jgi:hypothetical protein
MRHLSTSRPIRPSFLAFGVAAIILLLGSKSRPTLSQQKDSGSDRYFPETAIGGIGGLFTDFLGSAGEPSLVAIAHDDPKGLSYRLDWTGIPSLRLLVVRLSFGSESKPEITILEGRLRSTEFHKTQLEPLSDDAAKFMQLVEKSDFWSMPSLEPQNTQPDGRGPYKMDGDMWLFEGARNGSYHVAYRHSPDPGPFTQMIRFLVKDLAKLDDAWIPQTHASPTRLSKP